MKNQLKTSQKSIFDNNDDTDFLDQLNDAGKQSLEDFKVVQDQLSKEIENGLLTQKDVDDITAEFMESLRKSNTKEIQAFEENIVFTFENNRLQLFQHIPAILSNIPIIAKRYLESNRLLKNIGLDRVKIISVSTENAIEVASVFFITPYGSRINIELEHIYKVLTIIDFD
jgi:hypothetical protein